MSSNSLTLKNISTNTLIVNNIATLNDDIDCYGNINNTSGKITSNEIVATSGNIDELTCNDLTLRSLIVKVPNSTKTYDVVEQFETRDEILADIETINNDIATLNTQMTTANTNIATNQTNITTLQGQMTTANTNITTLQGQMTTANNNITTNTNNITTNTNDIATLNNEMTTANTNITSVQTQVSDVSTAQTDMRSEFIRYIQTIQSNTTNQLALQDDKITTISGIVNDQKHVSTVYTQDTTLTDLANDTNTLIGTVTDNELWKIYAYDMTVSFLNSSTAVSLLVFELSSTENQLPLTKYIIRETGITIPANHLKVVRTTIMNVSNGTATNFYIRFRNTDTSVTNTGTVSWTVNKITMP